MTTTSTLTDRYVAAALRGTPEAQRDELARELRERIGDEVDALIEQGDAPADAEYRALEGLGDPAVVSAAYLDRPLQLIGPRYFLMWWRLLKLLYAVVLPISVAAIVLAQLLAGAAVNEIIGSAVSASLSIAVHLGFWTTLVFALLERTGEKPGRPGQPGSPGQPGAPGQTGLDVAWKPEMLPQLGDGGRTSRLAELIASLAFLGLMAVFLVWQQFGLPWVDALDSIPLLDPALWSFWLPYLLVLVVIEAAFAVTVYLRGWGWGLAIANVALNLAFVVPALWLFTTGQLFNPAALDAIGWPWGDAGEVIVPIVVVVTIAGAAWDCVEGFIKAAKAR